jgi:diguanylate cyclase (GGDEF)-like protein
LATERVRFMALNDPLTRALNRRGIEQALTQLQASLPPNKRLALAYLDLDRFKLLNDLYGHSAGDDVLQQVCERIQTLLSDGMQFGRVGGDEFVLLLPGVSLELACLIGRGVLTTLSDRPYQVGDRAFQVRGSMGMIEVEAGTSFKDAMTSADRACREAKRGQSDGLVVVEHDAKMMEDMQAEMQLVARLAAGGEVEGLYLEMQPIMNLRKPQESLNFEVLLRMRDAKGRLVPTPRLITAGEQSGRSTRPATDRGDHRRVRAAVQRGRCLADGAPCGQRLRARAGAQPADHRHRQRAGGQPAGLCSACSNSGCSSARGCIEGDVNCSAAGIGC